MPAMKSKYPHIDPSVPGVYRRILEAAAEMRAGQHTQIAIWEARMRAARMASLARLKRSEVAVQLSKNCLPETISPLEDFSKERQES